MARLNKYAVFEDIGYAPMKHQRAFHDSEARFRLAVCGRRAGKTVMVARDRETDLLRPKRLGWIVAPTYDLGMKEFRVMWDDLIVGKGLGRDKRVKKNFNVQQGDMYIEFPWASRVEVRSAAYPEKLVGEGLDWMILAEAAKLGREAWEKSLRAALSDKRGSADFVTTPEGKNWLYKLWLLGRGRRKEYESWRFPTWVNTQMYPGGEQDEEILQMRETTLEEWFLQEIAAEFTAVVGRIFGEFAEDDNVLNTAHPRMDSDGQYVFNPDWPNYIAFDWGFANPLAAMEFQVSPRDEVFVWREHYHNYRTLEWHCDALKNRENPKGYRLDGAFGDSADPEAVEYISKHLVACQADPDSKQWIRGIRLMKRFLKISHDGVSYDDNGVPIMRPRYWVHPSCENHISEMVDYRTRKDTGSFNVNEVTGARVVDSKCSDHSIDAMRYALMHLYEVGVQHHLADLHPEWARGSNPLVIVKQRELEGSSIGSKTFFSMKNMVPGGRF